MGASLKPLTLDEFLAWDERQAGRYEFDGIQPVAMTGGSRPHSRIVKRTVNALDRRLRPGCEALPGDLRVNTPSGARYPDVIVLCGPEEPNDGSVSPVVVFEVLSPSTALTDMRVKPAEYAGVPSIQAYVILEQDRPRAIVLRRSEAWAEEIVDGLHASLRLPEAGFDIPLSEIYAA